MSTVFQSYLEDTARRYPDSQAYKIVLQHFQPYSLSLWYRSFIVHAPPKAKQSKLFNLCILINYESL